ncbi:uncharacterized protein LOC129218161 [Uloborus diversus]|uniref:uncharacterized protein LOC129218161 n=1 Tax=Uloborus diversus TaxID=327109 RepID=UPI0024097264|nr:uncharacterized protein LOC129218161 [Uloborus diversus]
MIDAIHLKPSFDFKGGNVVGSAFDCDDAATSAHTFMIQSMQSNYKEVVHVLPVKSIAAETLHAFIKKVIMGLEEIGFMVISVATDNNSINRKAMSFFADPPQLMTAYKHPSDPERPLFFLFDVVHILKCIRNNWLNQKSEGQSMYYPNFDSINSSSIKKLDTACFKTLRAMHELEHAKIVKYGYGLTLKALNPTNLERQNVKLVLQVFNEHVIVALNELGEKHNLPFHKETAAYINIILKWWWIVNVKTPDKGRRLKNSLMYPLSNAPNDERRIFSVSVYYMAQYLAGL